MNAMKKMWKSNYIYLVFFFTIYFFEIFFYQESADDATLRNVFFTSYGDLNIKTFFMYMLDKVLVNINGWSSRIIINFASDAMVLLIGVWKVLNAALYTLLFKSACEIFDAKNPDQQAFIISGLMIIPQTMYLTAGWLITSVAYFWPMALLMYILNVLKKKKYQDSKLHMIGVVLATLYVANEEIICIFLLIAFPIWLYNNRTEKKVIAVLQGITIFEMLWAFICPGNKIRMSAETASWFVDFDKLSTIKKMEMGFTATMNEMWLKFCPIIIVLTLFLFVYACYKNNSIKKSLWTAVPFLAAIVSAKVEFLANKSEIATKLFYSESKYGSISIYNYDSWYHYLPLIFYICIGGYILTIIISIMDYKKVGFSIAIVLLWAVATRCAMGFSPTIWASLNRTFSLLYYTILVVIFYFWNKLYKYKDRFLYQVAQMSMYVFSTYEVSVFIRGL